jgi:membrane-associated HD superfamily phosphohydrolase
LFCCCPSKLDILVVLNTFVSFIVALKLSSIFGASEFFFLFLHSTATSSSFWRLCFTHHRSKALFVFWNSFLFLFATCFFKVLFVFVFTIHFCEIVDLDNDLLWIII